MKNKIYILGLINTLLVFLGILFKVQHWAGASILLTLGLSMLVLVFLPAALLDNYKAQGTKENRILYIVAWVTAFIVFSAILFKVQHWPGSGYGLMIGLPLPFILFLPVFLLVTGRDKNHNIYNTVAVLFLLALISAFTAMLAIGVSKGRTLDSLSVCANYNRVGKAYAGLATAGSKSPLILKIDEAIKLTEEYKENIYRIEGITGEQWSNNPEVVMKSHSGNLSEARAFKTRDEKVHGDLQSALSDLITMVEKDPGSNNLAPRLKVILNMEQAGSQGYIWKDPLFMGDVQPWVHAYLEGLEVNLKLIKATL